MKRTGFGRTSHRDGHGGTTCAPCSTRSASCSSASPSSLGAGSGDGRAPCRRPRRSASRRPEAGLTIMIPRSRSAMGTVVIMRIPTGIHTVPAAGPRRPLPDPDALTCEWGRDLYSAGIDPGLPAAFRIGVSVLALTMLGGAALAAFLAPGSGPGLAVLSLLVAAGIPWAGWAMRDDNGPNWSFAVLVLVPAAVLGFGQWSALPIGLGSDLAYYMATFPALLLIL